MDTSTTLKEQIQALMDSLADTALSAAESRHQSQAGEAHLLYALYWNDGLVGSMLRGHGLESSEIRLLMSDIPNRPLKMGEDPVLSASSRHILHDAHVSEPPTLTEQIERTWNLNELDDCENMDHGLMDSPKLPKSSLDDGDWKCVAYADNQRTEVTVHINGNRVGLYKADGTVLKPVGKD
jgi:hypothetical protein